MVHDNDSVGKKQFFRPSSKQRQARKRGNASTLPPSAHDDKDLGQDTLLADGFEDALLGYGRHGPSVVAVYDWKRCVTILQTRDRMTLDEAEEFIEFNVVGSWLGQNTPVFLDQNSEALF
jgi:hypothetical protein